MGLGHLCRPGTEGQPCAFDLFPWWSLNVLEPERDSNQVGSLPQFLVEVLYSSGRNGRRHDRACALVEGALGLATPASLAVRIAEHARRMSIGARGWHDTLGLCLYTIQHLARTPNGASARPVLVDLIRRLIPGPRDGDAGELLRFIGPIATAHGLHELAEPIASCVVNKDPCVVIQIPGFLARLGEPGIEALRGLRSMEDCTHSKELKAALDAYWERDFDSLACFLDGDGGWTMRSATARLLGQLAAAGHSPESVLEMLLTRARTEEDSDTQSLLCCGIGSAVRSLGAEGRRAVVETIRETFDGGQGGFLFDALLVAGGEGLDPLELERLRPIKRQGHRLESDRNRAVNRLLAWQEGYPNAFADWSTHTVCRLLQWTDMPVPPAIQGWFTTRPTVEAEQVLSTLVLDEDSEPPAYCAAQVLRREPENLLPILELSSIQSLNSGSSTRWSVVNGLLAGCPMVVGLHPADFRAAMGQHAGEPLAPDWASAGRLLTIASTSLKQAQSALLMLAGMGPGFRELARHALVSLPNPEGDPSGIHAIPDGNRLARGKLDPAVLGGIPFRLPSPSNLPHGFQLLFGVTPKEWTEGEGCLRGLETMSLQQLDWSSNLARWHEIPVVNRILADATPRQIQRAILAAVGCGDSDLNRIGLRLAVLAPEAALEGPLGGLVGLLRQRGRELGVESEAADASPAKPPAPVLDPDSERFLAELEDLIED